MLKLRLIFSGHDHSSGVGYPLSVWVELQKYNLGLGDCICHCPFMRCGCMPWRLCLLGDIAGSKPCCPNKSLRRKNRRMHTNLCLFYVPIYLETLGKANTETGLRLVPLTIVFAFSSIAVGFIIQMLRRYYHVNIALQSISAISYGLLCLLATETPSWQVFVFLGILGIGVGGSYVTNLMGILTSVPEEKNKATVQAGSWSVRAMGVAVGLTVSSMIFKTVSRSQVSSSLQDPNLASQFSNTIAIDTEQYSSLNGPTKQVVLGAYMTALNAVFYFLLVEGLFSVLVSVFIKNNIIKQPGS